MFCPFCGTDNATDQRYCRNCGATLPTNTAKPSTKSHSPVTPSPQRPSGPFVPPQPPNLPSRRPNTQEHQANTSGKSPEQYSTNSAYALNDKKPSTADFDQDKSGEIDNFYETQVSFPIPPNNAPAKPAGKPSNMQTIEMGSLATPMPGAEEDLLSTSLAMTVINPAQMQQQMQQMMQEEEDLRSTSMAMSVMKIPTAPPPPPPPQKITPAPAAPKVPSSKAHEPVPPAPVQSASTSNSEESFPTVMTAQPPASREEQLRMLKEMMEAGEGPFSPPPPPPPPAAINSDQTLTMAAVRPKPDQLPKATTDEFAALDKNALKDDNAKSEQKVFDKTIPSIPVGGFRQSIAEEQSDMNPALSETMQMRPLSSGSPAEADRYSYPNMENSSDDNSENFDDDMSSTLVITPPAPKPPTPAPVNTWPTDSTNPWGSAPPSAADFDAGSKTEALSSTPNSVPITEEDPFRTTAVPSIPAKFMKEPEPARPEIKNPLPEPTPAPASTASAIAASNAVTVTNSAPVSPQTVEAYTQNTVAEAPAETDEPVTTPNKAGSKTMLIVVALVVVLAVLLVGTYLIYRLVSSETTPKVKVAPVPTVPATPKPKPLAPTVPTNMILIPAGDYVIGCDDGASCDKYSSPAHQVKLGAFYLDTYEVTNAEYEKFVKATNHAKPKGWGDTFPGKGNEPVVNVSLEDAKAYAKWAEKRLPTEDEWEAAAAGKDHLLYPWGNEAGNKLANTKEYKSKNALPVGSIAEGKSPFGLYDMSGNVYEWTDSVPEPYPNSTEPLAIDSAKSPDQYRVIRGGSYQDNIKFCTTTFRGFVTNNTTSPVLGFRCAKDAPEKK